MEFRRPLEGPRTKAEAFLSSRDGLRQRPALPQDRILVAWRSDNFRYRELVLPVLKELGPEQCVVIAGSPDMLSQVPAGAAAVSWDQAMYFDVAAWRADYRKCRAAWQQCVRALCRKHRLPRGTYDRLAFHILVATRQMAGCLEFLGAIRPSAIVTEYDRSDLWSCLVLCADGSGFPRSPWFTASSMIRPSLLFRSWPIKSSVGVKSNAGS